jgi:hypothetical protein
MMLLWTLHLLFVLLVFAAALEWGCQRSARWRYAALALALGPLLALDGYLTWKAVALRFDSGIVHAPWIAATSLLGLHLVGVGLLWTHRTREAGRGPFSAGTLLLCALAALALDLSTLCNLELRARLRASGLRFEAGRIAWRLSPPRPAADDNAAPLYLRAAHVFEGSDALELDVWSPALRGEAVLDAHDPALRVVLTGLADVLRSAREAASLASCWFEPKEGWPEASGLEEPVVVPRIASLLALGSAFALEARVRALDGDAAGALEDVDALFCLSAHLGQTPGLIPTLGAVAIRESGVTTLAHVLSGDGLELSTLERFDLRLGPSQAELAPDALLMEEAYGLGMLGWWLQSGGDIPGLQNGKLSARLDSTLFAVFLLDEDVAGYRATMWELQALAREPRAVFLEAPPTDAARVRGRGLLSSLLVPNLHDLLRAMHRSDVRGELACVALEAARHRAALGRYPTSLTELGMTPRDVQLEGDGSTVRLVSPGLRAGDDPLELRLPVRTQ